jgi:hypothetical protein
LRDLDDQFNHLIGISRRCVNSVSGFDFVSPFDYLSVNGTQYLGVFLFSWKSRMRYKNRWRILNFDLKFMFKGIYKSLWYVPAVD